MTAIHRRAIDFSIGMGIFSIFRGGKKALCFLSFLDAIKRMDLVRLFTRRHTVIWLGAISTQVTGFWLRWRESFNITLPDN
jgi:hypothetical protein